jgi:hypothetical protein
VRLCKCARIATCLCFVQVIVQYEVEMLDELVELTEAQPAENSPLNQAPRSPPSRISQTVFPLRQAACSAVKENPASALFPSTKPQRTMSPSSGHWQRFSQRVSVWRASAPPSLRRSQIGVALINLPRGTASAEEVLYLRNGC